MTYLKTKFYLKTNFIKPTLSFEWSQRENEKFFLYLGEYFSAEDLNKKETQAETKQAFVDFFEPVGYTLFRIKGHKLNVKVLPYILKAEDSKHHDELVNLLKDSRENIDFNYKNDKNQILIKGKLREELYTQVDLIDENINKKELLKSVVKSTLKLKDSDFILIKKKEIFIKIIDDIKKKSKQKPEEKRFNGFAQTEFEEIYNEYFKDKKVLENFIETVAKKIFNQFFIEDQVTNEFYEQNIYTTTQNVIELELPELSTQGKEFQRGFSGYFFRINFLVFFEVFSNHILYLIYKKDSYILSWFNYYSGLKFEKSGSYYIAPALLTKEKKKWAPVAVPGNIAPWFQKQDKIDTLTLRLRKIEISLSEIVSNSKVKDLEGNVKYIKLLSEEGKVENNIESVNRTIQTSQDTYQSIQLAFIKALTSKCKAV